MAINKGEIAIIVFLKKYIDKFLVLNYKAATR